MLENMAPYEYTSVTSTFSILFALFFILIIRYVTFGLTIVLLSRLSGIPSVILHVVHILLPLWSIQKLYYTTNSKSIGNIIMSVPNLHTNAQVATRRSVGFWKVFPLFIHFFGKGGVGDWKFNPQTDVYIGHTASLQGWSSLSFTWPWQ